MRNCGNVSCAGIEALASCPNLRNLNCRNCPRLRDRCVRTLAEGCPRLASLNLRECPLLTDDAITVRNRGSGG
eukprot:9474608-Pyramimonas_sp.AAC.1